MNYQHFVALREPACREFEDTLARARQAPRNIDYAALERLSFLYRQLLHDHSLAAARFPGTAMARRLRRLVLEGTHTLQTDTGENLPSLRRFVLRAFPSAMQRLAPTIGLTAAVFVLAALFGYVLASVEIGLAQAFLPAATLEALDRGEIWIDSLFAIAPATLISSFIATNNLGVAITGWAGGTLAGLGGVWVCLYNGVMLGSVLAATARYGMADRLLEFICAHGPLELSLIVVCAGAGTHIGFELVRAADRPRGERLRAAAIDALVVLIGCLPWILLLGFVEGHVSPSHELPVSVKVLVGLLLEGTFLAWAMLPVREPPPVAAAGPDDDRVTKRP